MDERPLTRSLAAIGLAAGLGACAPPPAVMGTKHPLLVLRFDPAGRWVAACQARRDTDGDGTIRVDTKPHGEITGDRMEPYLLLRGRDMPLDDYVAADHDGHRVAVVRGGRLVVVDFERHREIDLGALGADPSDDPSPFGPHRAASFDREGNLLYLKKDGSGDRLAVRSFAGPIRVETSRGYQYEFDEWTFSHGDGLLVRADLDPDGSWIVATVVPRDTNGNGKLDPPVWNTNLSGRRCRGGGTSTTLGYEGDRTERRLIYVHADGPKTPLTYPDMLHPLGRSILRRSEAGALLLTTKDGATTELLPAECSAKVLHADGKRELVVTACTEGRKPAPLEVHGLHVNTRLPISVDANNHGEREHSGSGRFFFTGLAVGLATSWAIVDLDRLTVRPLAPDEQLLHIDFGPYLLLERAGRLIRYDADSGTETDLGVSVRNDREGFGVSLRGPLVSVDHRLWDIARGRIVGRIEGDPVAITTKGATLYLEPPGLSRVSEGPIWWREPLPP